MLPQKIQEICFFIPNSEGKRVYRKYRRYKNYLNRIELSETEILDKIFERLKKETRVNINSFLESIGVYLDTDQLERIYKIIISTDFIDNFSNRTQAGLSVYFELNGLGIRKLKNLKYSQFEDTSQLQNLPFSITNYGANSNIQVGNNNNSHITINNEITSLIDKIIEIILDDNTIDSKIKRTSTKDFELLNSEVNKGEVSQSTWQKILIYGDQVSSITGFLITLHQILTKSGIL